MPPKIAQNGPKMAQKVPQKSCRSSRIQNPFFESELQTYRNGMCPVLSIHMLPTPGQQHFQENHHLKDHSSCIESLLIRFKPFQTHAILLTRLAGQISNVNFQVSSFSRESITNRITIWHGIKFSHGKKYHLVNLPRFTGRWTSSTDQKTFPRLLGQGVEDLNTMVALVHNEEVSGKL